MNNRQTDVEEHPTVKLDEMTMERLQYVFNNSNLMVSVNEKSLMLIDDHTGEIIIDIEIKTTRRQWMIVFLNSIDDDATSNQEQRDLWHEENRLFVQSIDESVAATLTVGSLYDLASIHFQSVDVVSNDL